MSYNRYTRYRLPDSIMQRPPIMLLYNEEDCGKCPYALVCASNRFLGVDHEVSFCSRCYCLHFGIGATHFVCGARRHMSETINFKDFINWVEHCAHGAHWAGRVALPHPLTLSSTLAATPDEMGRVPQRTPYGEIHDDLHRVCDSYDCLDYFR